MYLVKKNKRTRGRRQGASVALGQRPAYQERDREQAFGRGRAAGGGAPAAPAVPASPGGGARGAGPEPAAHEPQLRTGWRAPSAENGTGDAERVLELLLAGVERVDVAIKGNEAANMMKSVKIIFLIELTSSFRQPFGFGM